MSGSAARVVDLPASADAIVVGGGTAGAVIAARLVESGRSVIVLDAGPDYGSLDEGRWPPDLLNAASLPTSHDWGYAGAGAEGQPLTFDRARVIGGCSSHNGCTQSAGWSGDWDRLATVAGEEWSASAMAPFFDEASRRMRLRQYSPRRSSRSMPRSSPPAPTPACRDGMISSTSTAASALGSPP